MKKRNFYLKSFLPRLSIWAVFSGFLGFFFILARAGFEDIETRNLFVFLWLFYIFSGVFFASFFNGGASALGFKNLEHEDSRLINKYIVNGHIDKRIPSRDLQELFSVLKKEPTLTFVTSFIYGSAVSFFSLLTMFFIGVSAFNLIIILMGGIIATITLSLFSIFFVEVYFVNDFLRECRFLLKKRKIKVKEGPDLFTLKNRFSYFIILLFLVVVVILSFIPKPGPFLLLLIILFLGMTIITSRMLFSSVYLVFKEIEDFADDLPRGKKTEYFTGSLYKEILDLSYDLNKSAKQIYEATEKEKKSKEELQRKVKELNKWFKLAVGRELKMIELKEEIKKIKKEVENIKKKS